MIRPVGAHPVGRHPVDDVLEAAVASGRVPLVVAAAADDDGPCYVGAAGPRAVGDPEPVTPDAVFRIASMTKMLVTVAALQLAERGRLDLDRPVGDYLHDFDRLPVLDGFDGEAPVLRRAATRATVRHLATHTTGLSYWFWNADILRWEKTTGTPNVLRGSARSFEAPLVADPGTRFEYGINTDWLGRVVEVVAGRPLDAYVEEMVTEPLGMTDTTFHPDAALRARLVPVHRRGEDGVWAASDVDWNPRPDWWSGGHGLYSTALDYLRFQRMLLGGGVLDGVRIVSTDSLGEAFTNQIGDLWFPPHIATAHPASSADVDLGPGLKWGLGLLLTTERAPGLRAAGSGGWAGIFNTFFWVDRASGLTGAVHTQLLPFADPGAMSVYTDVERALYAGR